MGNEPEVTIQLDNKNFVRGQLQDGKNILMLFDSGATRSILSKSVVKNSRYLSSLKPSKVEPISFRLGNGQFLVAHETLTFIVHIQGHRVQLNAFVTENLTGIDLLLGTDALKQLNGVLDFSNNSFKIKPSVQRFRPTSKVVIYPGQCKYINVQSRVPSYVRNTEVILQPAAFIAHMCPTVMMVKLHKGRTRFMLTNNGTRPFVLSSKQSVASFNLSDIALVTHELHEDLYHEWLKERQFSRQSLGHVNTATSQSSGANSTEYSQREHIRRYNLHRYPHLKEDDPLAESEIIRQQVSLNESALNSKEREEFYQILDKNKEVFSLYGELSSCPNFEADMSLTNTEPFFIRPYRLPPDDKIIVSGE